MSGEALVIGAFMLGTVAVGAFLGLELKLLRQKLPEMPQVRELPPDLTRMYIPDADDLPSYVPAEWERRYRS